MILPWLDENIRDFKRRSVNLKKSPKNGTVLVLIDKHISLLTITDGSFKILKKEIIDYKQIAKERSIERRLKIVIDSMYDVDEFFFVEENLVHKIIYGFTE